jgi:hypothetical protein
MARHDGAGMKKTLIAISLFAGVCIVGFLLYQFFVTPPSIENPDISNPSAPISSLTEKMSDKFKEQKTYELKFNEEKYILDGVNIGGYGDLLYILTKVMPKGSVLKCYSDTEGGLPFNAEHLRFDITNYKGIELIVETVQ